MFERYDDGARRAVVLAHEEARRLGHDTVGSEHLLLGLLYQRGSTAVQVLAALGVPLGELTTRLEHSHPKAGTAPAGQVGTAAHMGVGQVGPGRPASAAGQLPLRRDTKQALQVSLREALSLGDSYVGTEHLVIALLRIEANPAGQALMLCGVDLARVRGQLGREPRGRFAQLGLVRPRGDLGVMRLLSRVEHRARAPAGRGRLARPLRGAGAVAASVRARARRSRPGS